MFRLCPLMNKFATWATIINIFRRMFLSFPVGSYIIDQKALFRIFFSVFFYLDCSVRQNILASKLKKRMIFANRDIFRKENWRQNTKFKIMAKLGDVCLV